MLVSRGIGDLAKLQEFAKVLKLATDLRESIAAQRKNLRRFLLEARRHFERDNEVGHDQEHTDR